jgi:fructoselysine-6-P-deglycase FrlB-like protein
MLTCKGNIFFTGVGKSGFIAQKISQILVSTGTRATFLSPTDALHGDIGIVHEGDIVVMFSKSGNTEEMLKLVPFVKVCAAFSCLLLLPLTPRHLDLLTCLRLEPLLAECHRSLLQVRVG